MAGGSGADIGLLLGVRGGGLSAAVSGTCRDGMPPAGLMRFDLVSPDLSALPAWQNRPGFAYSLSSSFVRSAGIVKAQALLRVKKSDGTVALFREESPPGTGKFVDLAPTSPTRISAAVTPPAGGVVQNVIVRVFVAPVSWLPAGGIVFDSVCPQ